MVQCVCGVGPAAAALIHPLAWELAYAAGSALKRQKKKKNQRCIIVMIIKVYSKDFIFGKKN